MSDTEKLALLRKILVVEDDPLGWVEDRSLAHDRYLAALDVLGAGDAVRAAAKESGYTMKTPEQVLWTRGE
jgi:hypothetical protein